MAGTPVQAALGPLQEFKREGLASAVTNPLLKLSRKDRRHWPLSSADGRPQPAAWPSVTAEPGSEEAQGPNGLALATLVKTTARTHVAGDYVGHLASEDPLKDFLAKVLRDRMRIRTKSLAFQVYRMPGAHETYCYQEKSTRVRVVCKFFGTRQRFTSDPVQGTRLAQQEYDNLNILRGYGLIGSPHHVVEPFGVRPDINAALAVEYFPGEGFAKTIRRGTCQGDTVYLRNQLGALAHFLSNMHIRTAVPCGMDFGKDCELLTKAVERLFANALIGQWDVDEMLFLRDLWRTRPRMWHDSQAWLHGDATSGNFLFGAGSQVVAIDLEAMRHGDPAVDLGYIVAEIQHAFMLATGHRSPAEPFIGHFFREYCSDFPDPGSTFKSITARTPFYMARNLLRIADSAYVTEECSHRLVEQAKTLLRVR
jgi:Phosphotransferase enzyme family